MNIKELKISKEISLPINAVTQTMAMIGRKGAGKTYLASMIAEQMLDTGSQVIVVDPVGNWWGLRVDADGKSKGKEIFVIGGDHGDIPLVPEAGARIAQLLVEKEVSAIIDVSSFRIGEHKRFAADFAEEFFHLKKSHRSPVHIFIEEAQKIIPQRVGPDEARMVGAFEQIVRLGRNYGIGCSLVTQRPQSVNKEVLSQVECLCVLQVTGPHERKALEEWVQEVGADRTLIGELPGLAQGEGYVWSPAWLRVYKRVHFSKKQTFDASATPEVGKKTRAASISAVDVEALKKDMADVVSKAEKDNPVLLRKRIVELEKQASADVHKFTVKTEYKPDPKMIEVAVQRALDKQGLEHTKEINKRLKIFKQIHDLINPFLKDGIAVYSASEEILPIITSPGNVLKNVKSYIGLSGKSIEIDKIYDTSLSKPEQKILDAIAWLDSIGNKEPAQTAVAFLSGYTVGGGAFNNPKGSLRSKGLVEYRGQNIALTLRGCELAHVPDEPLTTESLHEKVLSILPGPERKLLTTILRCYPDPVSLEYLAAETGYTLRGGAFNNPRGRLRSLGLIEYVPGGVIAKNILFI